MNSAAIDFVKLRKIEKLRAKKERLQKKKEEEQQQQQRHDGDGDDDNYGALITPSTTKIENGDSRRCSSVRGEVITSPGINASLTVSSLPPPTSCCNDNASELCIEQYNICGSIGESNKQQQCQQQLQVERPILLRNVYYIPQILSSEYMDYLSLWLHGLPHHDSKNKHKKKANENNDEKNYHGKWTRLKHARRNVALFDLRKPTIGNAVEESIYTNANTNTNTNTCTNNTILDNLCQLLINIQAFPKSHPPNHVLINEYQPSEGIMPHTDGPLYFHKTATFSIGGDVLFQFTRRLQKQQQQENDDDNDDDETVMQIMLSGKGSLIVFDDDAYINHCHSINDRIEPFDGGSGIGFIGKDSSNDVDVAEYVEYASEKCVNLTTGSIVKRDHRFSLTFRHKYL